MRHTSFRSFIWILACVVIVLLAMTTGSAVAHELQHAAHHNAAMHGTGICAWMCATAGTHVATPVDGTHVFGAVSHFPIDVFQASVIQPLALVQPRAPPVCS